MARIDAASKGTIEGKRKVKTGCTTCRARKVKCDESKPYCQKCVSTGRTCDGYESPFRASSGRRTTNARAGRVAPAEVGLVPSMRPAINAMGPLDVDLLSRYFSTKTVFNVKLGCDEEARQVLQASFTDAPIRHAILSLKAFREDFETLGEDSESSGRQQTPSHKYALEQYGLALGGLASNLSSLGSDRLQSALLCCQIFISIEQVRGNYAAMAQHMIRGLGIMHEYRARPDFVAANNALVPAHRGRLPLLDVFIIKLFAAPCKFADPPSTTADAAGMVVSVVSPESHQQQQQPVESRRLRAIAPDMRTQLIRISASTLEFLNSLSQVDSAEKALRLRVEKAALLDSLASWLSAFELLQANINPAGPEPISASLLRVFHLILKIVLSGALSSSTDAYADLEVERSRLQKVASDVGEKVQASWSVWSRQGSDASVARLPNFC